ncbi:hypothetical protein skT53_35390 [Effusibacillus dendaii]|uniref:YqeG family HAD IIIA-type phosphatase n=1 Tax=Effusibacillus dendaii TaxID=2743772 RepID=A0A7I8DEK6_9BACL|nr:YqeG family HAD IIIA-type phosphatase [Effusibacillus dendaii]BCJ88554.1 hypothetical protein skT53_35390 [Effusibacillus dendaii]
MFRQLIPSLYVKSIYDIDLDALQAQKIKGILTDLDNTLVAWNSPEVSPELANWLAELKRRGMKVCIVSNNKQPRVEGFARQLGLPSIFSAKKPIRKAFRQAMRLIGTQPHETVVIGDQIFTDVLGGNRMGLYTILVIPLAEKEFIGTKLLRAMERFVLKDLHRRGMVPWKN